MTNLSDVRSLIGTITFDSSGHFSFIGQQLTGNSTAVSQQGSGSYSVDSGGFVTMDSPLRTKAKLNARYSIEAVLGSSTESSDNTFDLFVAIPAPAGGAVLGGPYTTMALEFPGGTTANMRATEFSLYTLPLGNLTPFTVSGHAANLAQGIPQTQQVTGATFTMGIDGTGSFTVGAANTGSLLSGTKTLYLSATGNVILGGSTTPGGHDIVIGVKAPTGASNASWNSTLWGAGLRVDTSSVSGYAGAVASRGQGKITWTKRFKALVQSAGVGDTDYTGINNYNLNADGTGTSDLTVIGLGAGSTLAGAAISPIDPGAYEIYFGAPMPAFTGSGVYLNPLGVINAASFAPPGNPIAPGQFVALFGTGLAAGNQTAKPPYPTSLGGVSVLINGKNAPLYFVSPGQINALVPFATTGPTATIVVQNNSANSNTVTVPVAATSPGVYSLDQSGYGSGAILHADYSLVNDASPALPGETVLIYLTGMGTTNPSVADGTAGNAGTLYDTVSPVAVYVGGKTGAVVFNGLAPGFPGLYQINVTLPSLLPGPGRLPLAIGTGNAYHDQVDISTK